MSDFPCCEPGGEHYGSTPVQLPPEFDLLELENIRWKVQLMQSRHLAGITREDMIAACGGNPAIVQEVEDLLEGDPRMSTLRRYAAMVGAVSQVQVIASDVGSGGEDRKGGNP